MSWSYRSDRQDELYSGGPGPGLVSAQGVADAQAANPGGDPKIYAASGAIDVRSHTAVINVAGVGAMTLAAPTRNGILIKIVSNTANAHTVTATGLINNGTTGGPHNLFTMVAFPGCSIELLSFNGIWNVMAQNLGAVS